MGHSTDVTRTICAYRRSTDRRPAIHSLEVDMPSSPSILTRLMFGLIRGLLVVVTLLVAFVATAFIMLPLAIFVLPLPVILAGLLVLYVLGATESMADNWHARHSGRARQSTAGTATTRASAERRGAIALPVDHPAGT
jgi:hypothetical protein